MLKKFIENFRKEENQKGFTLIELIIVMAILAVLTGVAVPKFAGVLSDARNKANTANLELLQNAVDLYITNEDVNAADVNDFTSVISKGYLQEPVKPPSGYTDYTVADGIVGQ